MFVNMAVVKKTRNLKFFLVFVTFVTNFRLSLNFNLDTKFPVVKVGRPGSYFGYSVANHKLSTSGKVEHAVLVGAPKDNFTFGSPEVQSQSRPGAVYSCPITSGTNDCTQIKVALEADPGNIDNTDAWMGVSVSSQNKPGGKAAFCSHLMKGIDVDYIYAPGICYVVGNDLQDEQPMEPCNDKFSGGHATFGLCQAGVSSALDQDGILAMGAPGSVNWRGTVFGITTERGIDAGAQEWFQPAVGASDPNAVLKDIYTYLGMSVAIGNIIKGQKTFVSGVPRSKEIGQVLMFTHSGKIMNIKPEHYLTGDQFGSLFGYQIVVGDFNNDGKDDLVVGAPFYYGEGIGGAIYVYMNGPNGITSSTVPLKIVSRKMTNEECASLKCEHARFGFSLANLGDVNRDNFSDLAVGAPYEGDGAVYIFHGSASGIVKDYSQRIYAGNFSVVPKTFGYSLSGLADLDENGYADVVVGSFMSNSVYALRARPVVNLISEFEVQPSILKPNKQRCAETGVSRLCFKLKYCVRYTAEPLDKFTGRIELISTLDAEKFTGAKNSRVQFVNAAVGSDPSKVSKALTLNPQSEKKTVCDEQLAYISQDTKDFLHHIPIQLTFKFKDEKSPVSNPVEFYDSFDTYPILNVANTSVHLNVSFENNCGADLKCESDLKLTVTPSLTRDRDGDYLLDIGFNSVLELDISVVNKGEDAHEAAVYITLPESFKLLRTNSTDSRVYTCVPVGNFLSCDIGNPLKAKASASFKVCLDASNASPSEKRISISVTANTSSIVLNPADDFVRMNMKVVILTDMVVTGQSSPESAYYTGNKTDKITTDAEAGPEVKHIYVITNGGRVKVAHSTVKFWWPYALPGSGAEPLLYLVENPQIDGPGRCDDVSAHVNTKKLTITTKDSRTRNSQNDTQGSRLRRDEGPRTLQLKIGGGGTTHLKCTDGSAKCFEFTCTLNELNPGASAVVTIRSRLWNNTFLGYYRDVDAVFVHSRAEVKIDENLEISQTDLNNDILMVATKVYPDKGIQEPAGVPWWIILIAVLFGLILLILLVVLLWKCGFFKRNRDYEMMRHEANVLLKTDDYDDIEVKNVKK